MRSFGIRLGGTAARFTGLLGLGALVVGLSATAAAAGRGPVVPFGTGHNANGEIAMTSPSQKIKFNIAQGNVEYWNFDYAEGTGSLHYTSTITCGWVDSTTNEARFMFQIPDGHPGLSGLYVVSYVKIVDADSKSYLYGHAATSDQATAQQWCQTGAGFAPGMYPVRAGVIYVK
jgi:hypothetical protein